MKKKRACEQWSDSQEWRSGPIPKNWRTRPSSNAGIHCSTLSLSISRVKCDLEWIKYERSVVTVTPYHPPS